MCVCTFFGHRNCPDTIRPKLIETLIDLIENHNVDLFYVGNQGRFDAMDFAVGHFLEIMVNNAQNDTKTSIFASNK